MRTATSMTHIGADDQSGHPVRWPCCAIERPACYQGARIRWCPESPTCVRSSSSRVPN